MIRFLTIALCSYVAAAAVWFVLLAAIGGVWDLVARQRTLNRDSLTALAILSLLLAILDTPLAMYYAYAMGLFAG